MDIPDIPEIARWLRGRRAGVLLIGAFTLSPAALLVIMLIPSPTVFSVEANSDVMSIETERPFPGWFVPKAVVLVDPDPNRDPEDAPEPTTELKDLQVRISPGVHIRFERMGSGDLDLVVTRIARNRARGAEEEQLAEDEPIAALFNAEDEPIPDGQALSTLLMRVELDTDGSDEVLLPILGRPVVGDMVHSQTDRSSLILRSGRVRLLARQLLGSERYEAGGSDLEPGNRVEILGERDGGANDARPLATGHGFVRADTEMRGLHVVFKAKGKRAWITQFGSSGYPIAPTLWTRYRSDPFLQVLLAIYASLLPGALFLLNSMFWGRRELQRRQDSADDEGAEAQAIEETQEKPVGAGSPPPSEAAPDEVVPTEEPPRASAPE